MSKLLPEYAASFNSTHYFPDVTQIEGDHQTPLYQPFSIPGMVNQMRNAPESLFINPEMAGRLALNEHLLRSVSFIHHDDWSVTRQDSSQGIFFGDLNLAVDKGIQGKDYSFPVAVKPYLEGEADADAWETALHEYIGSLLINSTESIRTFAPLGVWVDEYRQPFLLTHFKEEAVSLDNFNLIELLNEVWPNSQDATFAPLQFTADVLALLHAHGFGHGDAQIKNFARDTLHGLVCDLSRLRRFLPPDGSPPDTDTVRRHITADLKFLIASVVDQSYLPPENDANLREIIANNLISPYLDTLHRPDSGPINDLCCSGDLDLPTIAKGLLDQV